MTPLVELRDVAHSYGGRGYVLKDVSISIAPGEAIALVGASGSGKTTLLSIIGLLLAPTSGTTLVNGVAAPRSDRHRAALRRRRFSWVFQTTNALGARSVIDNAALGALAQGMSHDTAVNVGMEGLRATGLAHLAHRPARSLSGGELQRACIARALSTSPAVLLADEPTGQLDRRTSAMVLDALWAARGPETALVIATHDHSVSDRCDRQLHLVDGMIKGGSR